MEPTAEAVHTDTAIGSPSTRSGNLPSRRKGRLARLAQERVAKRAGKATVSFDMIKFEGKQKFIEWLEWVGKTAAQGTGVTLTAEDNGGVKKECYFDGDGGDGIFNVKMVVDSRGDKVSKSYTLTIAKSAPTGAEMWAWASVVDVNGEPVVDYQGDMIDVAELEKAADAYMTKSRDVGLMHQSFGKGRVVQSMVFTKELQDALGIDLGKTGWLVKMAIDCPETRKMIADGTLRELSIGGVGRKVPA